MSVTMRTLLLALAAAPALALAADPVTVAPREIDDLLANPGMGWQTFHRFAGEDPNLAGLPSTSAYFRFYWRELEPEEGKIDFAKLDGLLARARKAGQTLSFRVMCAGTDREYLYVPSWLKDGGCPGFEYRYGDGGPVHWVPDMDSPRFLEPHLRFIRELGKRLDGHPDLDLVDIGSVGLWGEWHMSGTGVKVPSPATRIRIVDAWRGAFPRSPKAMLIGDEECLRHAAARGCGWRADCLGDMGGFSRTWNHMEHFYRQQLEKTGAGEAWRAGPVAFESCWDMRKWVAEKWDVKAIFDYAVDLHASYMNNKSAPIPDGSRPDVERFLRRLGYRLVLREMSHPPSAAAGSSLEVGTVWENAGSAPPYRDWPIALRLRPAAGGGKETVTVTDRTVRGLPPGRSVLAPRADLPAELAAGTYELAIGVVHPDSKAPAVRLAIGGGDPGGWYPLSKIEILEKTGGRP